MNKTAKIIIAVLVVLVVGLGYNALRPQRFGGTTNYNDLSVDTLTSAGNASVVGLTNSSGTTQTGTTNAGCLSLVLNQSSTRLYLLVNGTSTGNATTTGFFLVATSTKPASCL